MPSTPSDRLRIELQARGENVNSWGDTRLNEALKRLEEAVAGVLTLTVTGDTVLTSQNFIADQSRMGTIVLTGTPAANFRVTIPGVQKTYNVINLTPRIANFGVADMATVSVRAGLSNLVVCDGTVTRIVDLTLDQIRTAAAAVNLGGQRLTNIASATVDSDGINRGQTISLTQPLVDRAQEWANKTGAVVDAGEYSAKEYAVGTTVPAGSAKEWSITTGNLVDATEYAAKEYAIGSTTPSGSAKSWATLLSSVVAASEYSAKEYAVGATTPLGSAKRWATATGVVADGLLGARGYANNASGSAQAADTRATDANNSAGAAAGSAQSAADRLADFNNRYVVASQFPTAGNFAGRLAFATDANQFGVYDGGTNAYQAITLPSQATTTTAGIVRLATASEALAGTNTQAVITAALVRSASGVRYLARSSNTQLAAADSASLIDATGTFTQTFAAPGTLGANWYCFYKNAGTGNITIPASDGRTNWIMYPGEMRLFQCDGTTLRSEVLWPFRVVFLASTNFIKPPGYQSFEVAIIGGAGGGGGGSWRASTSLSGGPGGSGATGVPKALRKFLASLLPNSVPIEIGAGGNPGANATASGAAGVAGQNGGATSFSDFSAVGGGAGGGSPSGGGNGANGATTTGGISGLDYSVIFANAVGTSDIAAHLFGLSPQSGFGGGGRNDNPSTPQQPSAGTSGACLVIGAA